MAILTIKGLLSISETGTAGLSFGSTLSLPYFALIAVGVYLAYRQGWLKKIAVRI